MAGFRHWRKRHCSAVWQSILFTGSRFSSWETSDAASLRVVWLAMCADPDVVKRGENDLRTASNGLVTLLLLVTALALELELELELQLALIVVLEVEVLLLLSRAYFL
jgi:hypothetical protein